MSLEVQLNARQQLAMTPELQHSIKLLQLSAQAFAQEVEEVLSSNPFLEREDEPEAPLSSGVAAAGPSVHEPEVTTAAEPADGAPTGEPDFTEEHGYSDGSRTGSYRDPSDDADVGSYTASTQVLRDVLLEQVQLTRLAGRERDVAALMVHALDDDGYLRQSFEDLGRLIEPAATETELLQALRMIQSFEPAGVGARSPRECVSLQLKQLPADDAAVALARRMVEEQFELLVAHDILRLCRALDCDETALTAAYARIRRCNPRPGADFGPERTQYVVADVIVRKRGKRWMATINPEVVPKLNLQQAYAEAIHRSGNAPLAAKLQEARWFIRNVEQRFRTIQRVAQAILDRQGRFFDYGDLAIKPLVLRDIAESIGVHESTVSRVTSNKYMATPRGLIEFKFFFGSHVESDGHALSATAVRALIRQIIAEEPRERPMSDITLTRMLAQKGVHLARRTVSKYRDSMQIPPVEARRLAAHASVARRTERGQRSASIA